MRRDLSKTRMLPKKVEPLLEMHANGLRLKRVNQWLPAKISSRRKRKINSKEIKNNQPKQYLELLSEPVALGDS
ncbi:MAG: hypothetical protein AAFR87_34435, partial [Bacteroidota bacterium]